MATGRRTGSRRRGRRFAALLVVAALLAAAFPGIAAGAPAHASRDRVVSAARSTAAFLVEKAAVSRSLAKRDKLPDSKVLETQPRQQSTDYNCGPAVAQVIINYTRGLSSSSLDGVSTETNWTSQSTLGRWMGTTVLYGTGAPGVTRALNVSGGLRKPFAAWSYATERTGTAKNLHDKVVTDIAVYDMPLAIAVNPHMAKVGIHQLASWPDERPLARHWIVIRGYEGLWGSPSPLIHYSDSSAGYGGGTGNYWDLSEVLHETNQRNYGRIVW